MCSRAWSLWKVKDTRRTSCLQCIWLTALIHDVLPLRRVLVSSQWSVIVSVLTACLLSILLRKAFSYFLLISQSQDANCRIFLPLEWEEDLHLLHLWVCVWLSGVWLGFFNTKTHTVTNLPPGSGSSLPIASSLRSLGKLTQEITCTLLTV